MSTDSLLGGNYNYTSQAWPIVRLVPVPDKTCTAIAPHFGYLIRMGVISLVELEEIPCMSVERLPLMTPTARNNAPSYRCSLKSLDSLNTISMDVFFFCEKPALMTRSISDWYFPDLRSRTRSTPRPALLAKEVNYPSRQYLNSSSDNKVSKEHLRRPIYKQPQVATLDNSGVRHTTGEVRGVCVDRYTSQGSPLAAPCRGRHVRVHLLLLLSFIVYRLCFLQFTNQLCFVCSRYRLLSPSIAPTAVSNHSVV
ncbi:hypothetical protein J6590_045707 [Homalodisca vitripennis]|nr:hypothetical protein J6590_045707 [Homalodisca vitripennis]